MSENQKLTSVKLDETMFDEFKVSCVRHKFSFQKLSERAMHLYLTDEDVAYMVSQLFPGNNLFIIKIKKLMKKSFKHLPKEKRKKILLICDDIRVHSGVATVARELVINTCQHFNWVNLAGAIGHPDKGKRFDISQDTNKNAGIDDSSVFLLPVDGYGDPNLLRQIIANEKPDALMLITDPRYFEWLFAMENEIRKTTPIIYLNIWDDFPTPLYNKSLYESCDA